MRGAPKSAPAQDDFIHPGGYVRWQGEPYRILCLDLRSVTIEHVTSQEQRCLAVAELLMPNEHESPLFASSLAALTPTGAPVAPSIPPPDATLSQALRSKASQIVACIEAIEERLNQERTLWESCNTEAFPTTIRLKAICEERGIALATYYRYRHRYRSHEGNTGRIAASLHRASFNQSRLSTAQEHFADAVILRFYAKRPNMQNQSLVDTARSILRDRTGGLWIDPDRCDKQVPQALVDQLLDDHVPMQAILDNPESRALLVPTLPPSRSWMYGRLKWLLEQPGEGKTYFIGRFGKDHYEHERLVFDTYLRCASRPLEYVFADFTLLNVFVVDEATRSSAERLWLTVLIDAYSRSVLGFALLYERPCIESIQTALLHTIWPKGNLGDYGLTADWPCYGIPVNLSLDNAWANHSHSLESVARGISLQGRYPSMTLMFRPPYKARYDALIERYFGRLKAAIRQRLKGAPSSSRSPDVRNAAREACLLYTDIYRFVLEEIVTYQNTPHSELDGLTPNAKWEEGLHGALPPVPPRTLAMRRLFWRLSPDTRTITREGLAFQALHYWSPELNTLARVRRTGETIAYGIRWNPDDLSCIAVYCAGQYLCDAHAKELRLPDGTFRQVSVWERQIVRELAQDNERSTRNWLVYLNALDATHAQRMAEKKAALRRARGVPAPGGTKIGHTRPTAPSLDTPAANTQHMAKFLNQFTQPHDPQEIDHA